MNVWRWRQRNPRADDTDTAVRRWAWGGGCLGILAMLAVLALPVWWWYWWRIEPANGEMAVLIRKTGTNLPAGQILAREPGQILARRGQKGIWEEPLAEGRHFLNPVMYDWEIRPAVRIPAGKIGVVTSKVGKDLQAGEFLARDAEKGVWRRVLGPGTYRLNPVGYQVDITDAVSIPIGYVGVVTSLSGEKAPEGSFAAVNQKGVRMDVLQPGLYYINPKEFRIDVLEIGLNQVSLVGKEGGQVFTKGQMEMQNVAMQELTSNALAQQKQKRQSYMDEQAQPANSGLSSARRGAEREVDRGLGPHAQPPPQAPVAAHKQFVAEGALATLGLAQYVEFPSRDGFEIRLDMTVEFELLPAKISEIFLRYGDLPAVVDKIIMPQILSVSRIKGSSYRAQDFIAGEGREKFQEELKETLALVLKEKKIEVHNSLIRQVEVPADILAPIQQASIAIEQNLTNIQKQSTAKKQAELNTAEALIEQRRQEVMQETEKLVAEIVANTDMEVASIRATAELQAAEIARQSAVVGADITRLLGETSAKVTELVEGEKANGFQLKVQAMNDPAAYTWMTFAEGLDPALNLQILHAGPGTLWTDFRNPGLGVLGGLQTLGAPPAAAEGKEKP